MRRRRASIALLGRRYQRRHHAVHPQRSFAARSLAGLCTGHSPHGHLPVLFVPRGALSASTFLPCLPSARLCSPRLSRLAPLQYYAGSDSCRALARPAGLSASFALPSEHPAPNHVARPNVALSVTSARPADLTARGFAMHEQARRATPPNRVRHPAGCSFASSCSPPRLAATQLPSASCVVTSHDVDSHHADRTTSRTHSCPANAGHPVNGARRSFIC